MNSIDLAPDDRQPWEGRKLINPRAVRRVTYVQIRIIDE